MTFFKYYNMNIKPIYTLLLSSLLFLFTISCSKEIAPSEATLSYQLIADKTWYLQYVQTTTGTITSTKSYLGQSTYFINYLRNLTTLDSDGLAGTYSLQNINNLLQIQVIAKTPNGNLNTYQYEVVSLGAKNMILSYSSGAIKTQLFFSTQR
jgi:hypothetical protein